VKTAIGNTEPFNVQVGVHQGSALSPMLFIIVMEEITREIKTGLPWEILFADDLILMAESEEELREKLRVWKNKLENSGMKVNMEKTKIMECRKKMMIEDTQSVKWPCAVCKKRGRQKLNSVYGMSDVGAS